MTHTRVKESRAWYRILLCGFAWCSAIQCVAKPGTFFPSEFLKKSRVLSTSSHLGVLTEEKIRKQDNFRKMQIFFPWYFLMINGLDFYFTFFFSSFFPTYIFLKSNHCFSHPFPHSLFLPCKKIIFKFIHCLCFCLFVETWYGSNNISFFCQHLKYIYSWVLKHWYILFFIFFFSIIDNFSGRTDAMAWPANCFSSWLQTCFFSFDFFHMLKMAEEKICIDPWNRISCSYFFIVFVF